MNFSDLNPSQKKAVTFQGKHLLVLAGAGTGKTKTIIARAAHLIESGVHPRKIQILTFTKRAAREIVGRVKNSLETNQAKTLNGSTFHSWCFQLLSRYPNLFGSTKFTVITEDDQIALMRMACGKNQLDVGKLRFKSRELLDLYSFARNTKRNLTDTIRFQLFYNSQNTDLTIQISEVRDHLAPIFKAYEQKKQLRKYLDYDDILSVVASRLQKDEQARKIIGSQYKHILVDEMQDTNPLQWDLLNPLQQYSHLFCVGDDAQSIYSFRGADFKNVHSFKERVKDAEVFKLEENYRSTQEILDLSNWLLEKSPIEYSKKLYSHRGPGASPQIINVEDNWEEAEWVSENVIKNYSSRNKNYGDHLVLSRSGFYTRALQAVFISKKIPYQVFGGRKFMEAAHLKDLISVIRIVNNIYDEIAWVRFLMFWEGIGEKRAAKYVDTLLDLSSIDECIDWCRSIVIPDQPVSISEILEGVAANRGNVAEAVSAAYSGMEKMLKKNYEKDWIEKRSADIPVFKVLAGKYSNFGEFIVETTLDNSGQIKDSPVLAKSDNDPSENKDKVTISTIHSAKGLESDITYVLNVSPKAFPTSAVYGDLDEIEEERRVLYVALTRAKNELIITRNIFSVYQENKQLDHPLEEGKQVTEERYFLNNLPENMVEQEAVSSTKTPVTDIDEANEMDTKFGLDFS